MPLTHPSVLLALCLQATGALPAPDEDLPAQVLASQRQKVEFFGFEEASDFHSPLPRPFFRILSGNGRPGFPDFGEVGVERSEAYSGDWSLKFTLDGAPIAVGIPRARIPIFPQSLYEVRTRVRTSGLEGAAAVLKVRLLDADGEELPGTFRTSEPVRTRGDWALLTVRPPMEVEEAVDLVFELHVEQGPRADIRGNVWFDDVEVWQLPRMQLEAVPPTGVVHSPTTPSLRVDIRDLTTGGLSAMLRTTDLDGFVVDEHPIEIRRGSTLVTRALEGLSPGWYHSRLELLDGESIVAVKEQMLSVLPTPGRPALGHRGPFFGVALPDRASPGLLEHASMIEALAPDYAVLPVWRPGQPADLDAARSNYYNAMIDVLHARQVEPVFEIASIPETLQPQGLSLDPDQVCGFLGSSPEAARQLLPWMAEFGDEVSRWRLRNEVPPDSAEATDAIDNLRVIADEFVAAAQLELKPSFPNDYAAPAESSLDVHLVHYDPASPQPAPPILGSRVPGEPGRIVHLRDGPSTPTRRMSAQGFALQAVETWASGADRIETPAPWEPDPNASRRGLTVEGYAFTILRSRLSGNPPLAEVPLGRGVRAVLAGEGRDAFLVAWSRDGRASMELDATAGPLSISHVDGTTESCSPGTHGHLVEIGESPVFVDGIDPEVARFRANVRIEPETIEASTGMHEFTIELANPWNEPVEVRLRPVGPGQFEFQPRSRTVTVQPRGTASVPFAFTYPRLQLEGDVDLRVDAELQGKRNLLTTLLIPTRIDSSCLAVEADWTLSNPADEGDRGVLVTVTVTNTGAKPLQLKAFCQAAGYPPLRRSLPGIRPGESASRTFSFPDGQVRLGGKQITFGAYEVQADSRVVRMIELPASADAIVEAAPARPAD